MEEIWSALAANPKASDFADLVKGLDYRSTDLPEGVRTYSEFRFPGAHRGFIRLERGLQIHTLPTLYWMNLDKDAIKTERSGTAIGIPQVLMSYARVSRGPWRLKALIDSDGHPVTSRFITVRPRTVSLEVLWALLNSPVANAYAFTHLAKRDNLVGEMRKIPMPTGADFEEIAIAARTYITAANKQAERDKLQQLMLKVDAAVLRQYALPIELEWKLLALFTGWNRVGVPFQQCSYFPPELMHQMPFADFVTYESDWGAANRRRGRLIDNEIAGTITSDEAVELAKLQAYADYHLEKVSPRPTRVLQQLEDRVFGSSARRKKEA